MGCGDSGDGWAGSLAFRIPGWPGYMTCGKLFKRNDDSSIAFEQYIDSFSNEYRNLLLVSIIWFWDHDSPACKRNQ